MELFKDKNKRRGAIGTIAFHVLLLVVFLFTGLTMPVPLPEEEGLPVQLDLGNVDFGSGEEQPQSTTEPEVTEPEIVPEPVTASSPVVEEEVATQEEEALHDIPEQKEEPKKEEKKPELDQRLKQVLESNPFKTNQDNNSKGEGNTDQPGDHGKANGSPDGSSLMGDKAGGGISFNLGGRKITTVPRIQGNMQESGRIVVEIIVDRNGNVVRVVQGSRGTTITNADLMKKVMDAARKAKFTPKADAPEEQKGTMTFEFILE